MMYLQMFGDLPEDATTPTVESTDGYSYETYDYSTDTFSKIYRPIWEVYFERIKEGIPTDDHIRVFLDPSGHLDGYRKVWNMHLGGVMAGQSVSRKEALDIARSASGGLNVTSIEHRIVRPMGGWPDGPFIYGTEPVCVWRVTFEHNYTTHLAEIDIDDTTGEIVGADEYC